MCDITIMTDEEYYTLMSAQIVGLTLNLANLYFIISNFW